MRMIRYYFDIKDDDGFALDDEGLQFSSIDLARREAEITLGEIAKDLAEQGFLNSTLSIQVRDENKPLFTVSMIFQVRHQVH